jgi:hypothetical protein
MHTLLSTSRMCLRSVHELSKTEILSSLGNLRGRRHDRRAETHEPMGTDNPTGSWKQARPGEARSEGSWPPGRPCRGNRPGEPEVGADAITGRLVRQAEAWGDVRGRKGGGTDVAPLPALSENRIRDGKVIKKGLRHEPFDSAQSPEPVEGLSRAAPSQRRQVLRTSGVWDNNKAKSMGGDQWSRLCAPCSMGRSVMARINGGVSRRSQFEGELC